MRGRQDEQTGVLTFGHLMLVPFIVLMSDVQVTSLNKTYRCLLSIDILPEIILRTASFDHLLQIWLSQFPIFFFWKLEKTGKLTML